MPQEEIEATAAYLESRYESGEFKNDVRTISGGIDDGAVVTLQISAGVFEYTRGENGDYAPNANGTHQRSFFGCPSAINDDGTTSRADSATTRQMALIVLGLVPRVHSVRIVNVALNHTLDTYEPDVTHESPKTRGCSRMLPLATLAEYDGGKALKAASRACGIYFGAGGEGQSSVVVGFQDFFPGSANGYTVESMKRGVALPLPGGGGVFMRLAHPCAMKTAKSIPASTEIGCAEYVVALILNSC